MAYDYTSKAAKAEEKFAYYGAPATLMLANGDAAFNPETGRTETTWSSHQIFAVQKSKTDSTEGSTVVSKARVQISGRYQVEPHRAKLLMNGTTYQVVGVEPHAPGGVAVYQFLDLEA